MSDQELPPLPPGFTVDEPAPATGGLPPLPPGFKLDEPEPPKGIGTRIVEGLGRVGANLLGEIQSAGQGISPTVTQEAPLGPLLQTDFGPAFADASGQWQQIDPGRHAVLPDPSTGRQMVYAREYEKPVSPIGYETSPGESLARIASFGATAPSVVPPAAVRAPSKAAVTQGARAQRAEDFAALGVPPTVGDITQSPALQRIETSLANLPTGGPLRARAVQQAEAGAEALQDIAGRYGQPQTPSSLGSQTRAALERFTGERMPVEAAQAISQPARATSFPTRAGALYQRVDDLIPPETPVSMESTRGLLEGTQEGMEGFEDIAGLLESPTMRQWREAIASREAMPYQTLKRIRSRVGQQTKWGQAMDDERNAAMKALYGSLTEDMGEAARLSGPEAVTAWNEARNFYREGAGVIKNTLQKVLNLQSDEAIVQGLNKAAQRKGGNIGKLRALKNSLRDQEWGDIAASSLEQMGRPTSRAPGPMVDLGFNPSTFVSNWGQLSDEAKNLLYGSTSLRRDLDRLAKVLSSAAEKEKFANFSNTFTQAGTIGQLGGTASLGAMAGATGSPAALAGMIMGVVGPWAGSKLLANPQMLRWIFRYPTSVRKAQELKRLSSIARRHPPIATYALAIRQALQGEPMAPAGQGAR